MLGSIGLGAVARQVATALGAVVALTILTGIVFPLVLLGLARALFPAQAAGGLVVVDGVVRGARDIGQPFAAARYFHPRPSAAGSGYDASSSSGTNFGPDNPKLHDAVKKAAEDYRHTEGLAPDAPVPIDAVTSSGSGLDPHISRENAALQVPRVARARGLPEDEVRNLVAAHTDGWWPVPFGQPRVSVLELNLALDRAAPAAGR